MPSSSVAPEQIRPATREDMPRVWQLIQELAEYERLTHTVTGCLADLERYAFDDRTIEVFVLEEAGDIVAYSISFQTFSTFRCRPGMWLEDIYVTPSQRGKGYGRTLLTFLMNLCETRGYGRMEWSVLDWNESAIRFYESMGAELLPDWRFCRVSMPRSSDPA